MTGLSPTRRNRLLLISVLLALVLAVLWIARRVLFPYIFALVLAYVLLPLVNVLDCWLNRHIRNGRAARSLAIILVYLLAAGALALFAVLVVPVVGQQFRTLWANRSQLAGQAQRMAEDIIQWYLLTVPEDIQAQINDLAQQASSTLARALQTGVLRTFSVLTNTVSFVLGMAVVPFWLFYVLYDQARLLRGVVRLVPARLRADVLNLVRIADDVFGAYLRGQLLLCLFVGVMAGVGLTLLGVQFPAVLGLLAGIFEILPFIGPILGAIPAILVATIQAPLLGLWTLLLFVGIQQVENLVLVPRISGQAVQLHPALIMVVLVIGNEVAGLWGMILAVPLAAITRDFFKYLYLRFQDQPVSAKEAMFRLGRTPLQLDV